MRHVATLVFLAAAAVAARADEIVLRNGARFEGQVKESGDTVTVVMDFGSMTFKKMDVARIERGMSALQEFDAKVAELKAKDIEGRYRLGVWAKQKELEHRARRLFEEVLERDPDHAGARAELGYRRVGARWVNEDEWKAELGLVLFRGEWVKRETADEIRRIEAERAAEIAKISAIESMRVKVVEAEAAAYRAQEEAARARAQAEADDYYYQPTITYYRGFGFRDSCSPRRVLHFGNAALIWPGTFRHCEAPKSPRCDDRRRN